MPTAPYIKATTLDYLAHTVVRTELEKLATSHPGVMALRSEIEGLGFKPVAGVKGVWGTKASWTASNNQTVSFEIHVQSFAKAGSKNQAALLNLTTIGSGGETDTYRCSLQAAEGDWSKAVERYADKNNKIRPSNSYWPRAWKCIKGSCGGPCINSLAGCTGGLAACIISIVGICGGCAVKCLACAGCNCKWWCKWAVGCCKD